MKPKAGQRWCLKSNPWKVAVVTEFIDGTDPRFPGMQLGHVRIKAPWLAGGVGGKSLDTFLKQYRHVHGRADDAD